MKIQANNNRKPEIAIVAGKVADEIDHFFELVEPLDEEISDYLTSEELDVLMDAASIMLYFEKDYTTNKRGY